MNFGDVLRKGSLTRNKNLYLCLCLLALKVRRPCFTQAYKALCAAKLYLQLLCTVIIEAKQFFPSALEIASVELHFPAER